MYDLYIYFYIVSVCPCSRSRINGCTDWLHFWHAHRCDTREWHRHIIFSFLFIKDHLWTVFLVNKHLSTDMLQKRIINKHLSTDMLQKRINLSTDMLLKWINLSTDMLLKRSTRVLRAKRAINHTKSLTTPKHQPNRYTDNDGPKGHLFSYFYDSGSNKCSGNIYI